MLFKIDNKQVTIIKENNFELEKDVQRLIENNLPSLFPDLNLTFIKTEFSIGGFRFDSVAFDEINKIFYIIEYKNIQKMSLVDQGVAYLKTLLDRKLDFVNLLEEEKNIKINYKNVDWSSTRVIFIAPSYNNYQLKISELNNAPFMLYKFTNYSEKLFSLEKIENKKNDKVNFKDLIGFEGKEIAQEIEVYTEESHFEGIPNEIVELYKLLKEKIKDIDEDITIDPKKFYIAFKGITNICDIQFGTKKLKVYINLKAGKLDDPFGIAKILIKDDGEKIGHNGNGDYCVVFDKNIDIDKLMFLIKQSYKQNG